jgi:hypothetical protein
MAHQLFCRVFRVAIFEVCYFRYGNPAGYVTHEKPINSLHHLMIDIGPFVLNSVSGAIIAFPSAIPVLQFDAGSGLDFLLIWLGVSIAMHAFPSTGDADALRDAVRDKNATPFTRVVGTPLVGLIHLGAIGSMIWLDVVYGVAIAMLPPKLLVSILA